MTVRAHSLYLELYHVTSGLTVKLIVGYITWRLPTKKSILIWLILKKGRKDDKIQNIQNPPESYRKRPFLPSVIQTEHSI